MFPLFLPTDHIDCALSEFLPSCSCLSGQEVSWSVTRKRGTLALVKVKGKVDPVLLTKHQAMKAYQGNCMS
jgi:hypothetical protein